MHAIPQILQLAAISALMAASVSADCGDAFPVDEQTFPVLITLTDAAGHEVGTGSGFYLGDSTNIFLVTAKHVLFQDGGTQLREPLIRATSYSADGTNSSKMVFTYDLNILLNNGLIRASQTHDIAAVQIGRTAPNTNKPGMLLNEYFTIAYSGRTNLTLAMFGVPFVGNYDDAIVGNDAYLFGYPTSIGLTNSPQFDYERPLLRKALIAQKYAKAHTVIIDGPVYFGDSGGPVVVVSSSFTEKSYKIIGIVTEFIPYIDVWENQRLHIDHVEVSNSGYSVVEPMDGIFELIHNDNTPAAATNGPH